MDHAARNISLSVGRSRPSPSSIQPPANADSPRTPLSRSVSSLHGSPSFSHFRSEEENLLVFEFGSRFIRAGFAGDSGPRCTLPNSPDLHRRVGDYRQWEPDYELRRPKRKRGQDWGEEYELWRLDVRENDMSLLEDKVMRLLQEIEHKYLLLDSRPRKVALVLPSLFPKPLLEIALTGLFNALQASTITLWPSAAMAAMAAGLRSALVVDIGHFETSISALFEFREVLQRRSVRAGKMLNLQFRDMLDKHTRKLGFTEVEDIMMRVGWCPERNPNSIQEHVVTIPIAISASSSDTLLLPASQLSEPVERVLFAAGLPEEQIDDDDLPIHTLAYEALLHLPIDVRKVCMSRIIIIGGPSNIPGVKRRLIQELEFLVNFRGWNTIKTHGSLKAKIGDQPSADSFFREKAREASRRRLHRSKAHDGPNGPQSASTNGRLEGEHDSEAVRDAVSNGDPTAVKMTDDTSSPPQDIHEYIPPNLAPQEPDEFLTKIRRREKPEPESVEGVIRAVNSLGAWSGASMIVSLRVRGTVELDKERFTQYGLSGGPPKKDATSAGQRQSMGAATRTAAPDRNSWTLGAWA